MIVIVKWTSVYFIWIRSMYVNQMSTCWYASYQQDSYWFLIWFSLMWITYKFLFKVAICEWDMRIVIWRCRYDSHHHCLTWIQLLLWYEFLRCDCTPPFVRVCLPRLILKSIFYFPNIYFMSFDCAKFICDSHSSWML